VTSMRTANTVISRRRSGCSYWNTIVARRQRSRATKCSANNRRHPRLYFVSGICGTSSCFANALRRMVSVVISAPAPVSPYLAVDQAGPTESKRNTQFTALSNISATDWGEEKPTSPTASIVGTPTAAISFNTSPSSMI